MYRSHVLVFAGLLFSTMISAQWKKYSFSEPKMGSPFNILFFSDDSLKAVVLAKQCYALVDSFNLIFSDYEPSSELSRLNAGAGAGFQKLSPPLWDIIQRAQLAYRKSRGAFDITVGPLSKLWRKARKDKQFPDSGTVQEKRKQVGFYRLMIDTVRHRISLPTGMSLDLGGIAKGYIAQQVVDFLSKKRITQALAVAGGDVVMSKSPSGTKGWVIGVNVPETTDELLPRKLLLENKAVSTSGDVYQYFEHNGIKYSHIIDPRTGYGIVSPRNVTVIASNGTDTDWLATTCSILPIATAKKLARENKAELLITELKKGQVVYYSTKGFHHYWKP